MPPIQSLSSELVNQIAAGEVLERPSSAVKELLENALDAGASRITVELVEGGRELLRVVDDGCGIFREQLPLAVASHATSKLRSAADLFRVRTLGFRGEALASIAGVSEFNLRSRPLEQETGAELSVAHGRLQEVRDCGCPLGTQVEVRDLFGSVPVRRKFLKSKQTELGHGIEAATRLAMAFPGVGFTLRHNERTVLERPAGLDQKSSVGLLFGNEVAEALLPVEAELDGSRVFGYVADPRIDRHNSRQQYFFVNNRWFRDRSLSHAVGEAYRGLMMTGRYPVTFLFIQTPPEQVDVNVHPQKCEVRFLDPHKIFSLVLAALRNRFLASDLTAKLRAPASPAAMPTTGFSLSSTAQDETQSLFAIPRGLTEPASVRGVLGNRAPILSNERPTAAPLYSDGAAQTWGDPVKQLARPPDLPEEASAPSALQIAQSHKWNPFPGASPSRAIQLHNSFLVVETDEGMLLIDQHALHERILYEEIKARVLAGDLEAQELLLPVPVELPPAQIGVLLEHRDLLQRIGLAIDEFGDRCILVRSQPLILKKASAAGLLAEIAGKLGEFGAAPQADALLDGMISMAACKGAVKAGDPLSSEEIDALLARRHLVEDSHHCPHGRPTVLRFTLRELEKQFRRI